MRLAHVMGIGLLISGMVVTAIIVPFLMKGAMDRTKQQWFLTCVTTQRTIHQVDRNLAVAVCQEEYEWQQTMLRNGWRPVSQP